MLPVNLSRSFVTRWMLFVVASGRIDRWLALKPRRPRTTRSDSSTLAFASLPLGRLFFYHCLQASIYCNSVYFYDECISVSDIGTPAMDELPTEYTEHDLPLLVLSGLGHDGNSDVQNVSGTRLAMQTLECEGERAVNLRQQFLARDGRGSAWNTNCLAGPNGSLKYHMQSVGRVGMPP